MNKEPGQDDIAPKIYLDGDPFKPAPAEDNEDLGGTLQSQKSGFTRGSKQTGMFRGKHSAVDLRSPGMEEITEEPEVRKKLEDSFTRVQDYASPPSGRRNLGGSVPRRLRSRSKQRTRSARKRRDIMGDHHYMHVNPLKPPSQKVMTNDQRRHFGLVTPPPKFINDPKKRAGAQTD